MKIADQVNAISQGRFLLLAREEFYRKRCRLFEDDSFSPIVVTLVKKHALFLEEVVILVRWGDE